MNSLAGMDEFRRNGWVDEWTDGRKDGIERSKEEKRVGRSEGETKAGMFRFAKDDWDENLAEMDECLRLDDWDVWNRNRRQRTLRRTHG